MLSKETSSTAFESLLWLKQGLNLSTPGHWQTLYSLGQWTNEAQMYIYTYIYIYIHLGLMKKNVYIYIYVLPYCFYHIWRELINVFSLIVCIPCTFCPTLGHHQGRIYYKSDVTFVFASQLCKSIFTVGVYSICF